MIFQCCSFIFVRATFLNQYFYEAILMKIISFLLVFVLLCSVPVFAAGTEDSAAVLSFTLLAPDTLPEQTELKIAVYDDEGRLVSITKKQTAPTQEFPVQLKDYLTDENKGTTLKAFFIDNELNPYTTSDTIGISTVTLDTPLPASGSAEILWANNFTMAINLISDSSQSLLIHIPSGWNTGATYISGNQSGIAPIIKNENGKQYVSVTAKPGKIVLQKRNGHPIHYLSDPAITTFYENKTGAVSITFDDGDYNSAVFYNSEFEKYGFHGTAFLIANNLKGIDNWKTLLAKGYVDVGNHSASHKIKYNTDASTITSEQLKADISGSYDTLKDYFPEQSILTFASPWGQTTNDSVAEMKKNHYANRQAGGGLQNNNPQGDNWFKLNAFVYNNTTTEAMNGWADQAIKNKGWAIELLHNCIEGNTPSGLTIAKTIFSDHMKYLNQKKDQLWVGSFNEVTAYIKERESAKASIFSADTELVILELTDSLPDDRFAQPLTLIVNVPSHWKNGVTYTQGSLKGESSIVKTESNRLYVQINAIPDQGLITLKKK